MSKSFFCAVATIGLFASARCGDVFLDISSMANMGFKDDVAGDGKGGWSDQGADNDFATFDIQQRKFGNVPFSIIDPRKNSGLAIMTFRSPSINAKVNLDEAVLDVDGAKASYLYVLHTCCYGSHAKDELVGSVTVKLKDGSENEFQLLNRRDVGDWWNPSNLPNGAVVHTKFNGNSTVGVYLSKFKISDVPMEIDSVSFKTAGKSVWIVVGATLSTESYELPKESHFVVRESSEWKAADMSDIVIAPGSALDLSGVIPTEPVGTYGRVIVNKQGNFAFEGKPDANLSFWPTSSFFSSPKAVKSKEDIKNFVALIRRQGYNMVRLHFLDYYLMADTTADLEFNEAHLDNFDYYIACLKENGIYSCMDGMSTTSGFKKGSGWDCPGNLKKDLIALPAAREHYRAGVTKLLTHLNPYTKTRLVDDPIIVVINLFNELEFYSFRGGLHPAMLGEWQTWLKQRYNNDPSALAKAWGRTSKFKPGMKFEDIALFDESTQWAGDAYSTDVGRFMVSVEARMNEWFESTMRSIGYRGLTTAWDMGKQYRNLISKAEFPVVTMHNYYGHPTDWLTKGSRVEQQSSISNAGQYWRVFAGSRFADRPYIITEYGHVFWSQSRYEEGILFGAYSALQGFQGIMVHSDPVAMEAAAPIKPFSPGSDPVERANQVMSAFLLGRHDVSPSQRYVELRFDDKYLDANGGLNRAPGAGTLLSLICRFGVWYDGASMRSFGAKPAPIAVINASGGAQVSTTSNTMDVIGGSSSDKETTALIDALKKGGLIPHENLSDPEKGVYQSDTGEILMETKSDTLTVITPRFEGIATDKATMHSLGSVKSVQSSIPSSVALIALDGLPLAKSPHLLLIYNTDALNSGMELSEDHGSLFNMGHGPTLIRTGALMVSLKTEASAGFEVWALGFNGKRVQKLPCFMADGVLHISIDTSTLEKGPTPFFEISSIPKG